jgi:5,10-methylenetetrahydromethanopterin reductase
VPLLVGASGPKVLRLGGRLGDGVLVTVGADPRRLAWARAEVEEGRRAAGLDPAGAVLGAHVAIAVADDAAEARALVRGKLATHARFAAMHGAVHGPADERLADGLRKVKAAYDMEHHAQAGSSQGAAITEEVLDAYAVAGPPAWCVDRLADVVAAGFPKLLLNMAFPGTDPADEERSHRRVVAEVLPALRERLGAA